MGLTRSGAEPQRATARAAMTWAVELVPAPAVEVTAACMASSWGAELWSQQLVEEPAEHELGSLWVHELGAAKPVLLVPLKTNPPIFSDHVGVEVGCGLPITRVVLLPVQLENVSATAGSEHQEVHPLPRQHLAFRPLIPLMLRQGVVMEIHLWQQSRKVSEASLHRVIPVGVQQQ